MKCICAALLALVGTCLGVAAPAVAQTSPQTWPTKPVRIVNTFAPGGAAEFLARTIADGMTRAFGQPFYVETRSGAGGQIGVQMVLASPPDGYNFVITNVSLLVLTPIGNPKLGYDPLRDLSNIAYIAGSPLVVAVNPATGIKTLDDFISYAKKGGKPLTYSSSGLGSSGHLFAETFARNAGIKVEHVPYKGAAQGLMDLVGGHITFSAQTIASSAALLRGGSLAAIAITANERMPDFPDVPTFKELGYPDVVHTTWFSLSGPAALPADIVLKVNREIVKTMARPDVQQRLRQEGFVSEPFSPDEFRKLIEAETVRWRPALERAGLIEK
jgi:tripartite-type tricarboxylate transporter receptor subunit TctC